MRPLTVAIHAELAMDGFAGGIEQFLMSLVGGLGCLNDGPEQYLIVARRDNQERLATMMAGNQRLVVRPRRESWIALPSRLAERLAPWHLRVQHMLRGGAAFQPPASDGFFESLSSDVVHFPFQYFEKTALPSVYNPHDLQHRHLPEFFDKAEAKRRDILHGTACRMATIVAAESLATRADIIEQYGVPQHKVVSIPMGAPTVFYRKPLPDDLEIIRRRYALPQRFMFYPAQFWPHKNHERLLSALAKLRSSHGLTTHLVCTGRPAHDWPHVRRLARDLKLDRHISFLGYIEANHLRTLYRLADFLILPSLFEGGGFPLLEAFQEGLPVACSSVTSLPEYGGDAALLFDPLSVDGMAEAIHKMWCDHDLRQSLRTRGIARAQQFTWEQTARTYRATYRKAAGLQLCQEDVDLLRKAAPTTLPYD
jgi:glycosyltransferase involved in cell wall biosynthesis